MLNTTNNSKQRKRKYAKEILLNLPDNGSSDNGDIDIQPSGVMPVVPDTDAEFRPLQKQKRKFLSPTQRTAAIISLIAAVLVTALFVTNFRDLWGISNDGGDNNGTMEDDSENGIDGHYLSDSEIYGNWAVFDYVQDIGDFDANDLKYLTQDMKLYSSYNLEFFDDRTAVMNDRDGQKIYNWINADMFNILPDNTNIVTVRAIKKIDGKEYMFAEFKHLDAMTGAKIPGYYVFKKSRDKVLYAVDDVRNKDIRNYNMTEMGKSMATISFNEKTRFPTDSKRLPQSDNLQPMYIMEHGKDPGLGIRGLHEKGIKGKNINVAIIDEPLNLDHPEYKGKIAGYKNFDSTTETSMQGPAIASLLAGETIGTAPGANIYYAAVPAWTAFDAAYYAMALDWIVETNETLPAGEKIRVACVSPNPRDPLPWINVDKYLESIIRARQAGILVLDCTVEHGIIVGACNFDFENREDAASCKPVRAYRIFISQYHYDNVQDLYHDEEEMTSPENMIRVPINHRTMAQAYDNGEFSYQYDGKGELSWAMPYITGVLAMGWQVKPELTADEIVKILFDTAYVDGNNNKIIYPAKFIEYLQKN